MSECSFVAERMPLLMTEALEGVERERAHRHIEECAVCGGEWAITRDVWAELESLPELPVPERVRQGFLSTIESQRPQSNVVSFRSRIPFDRLGQIAAALLLVVGGFAGGRALAPAPELVQPAATERLVLGGTRSLDVAQLDPSIAGNPDIQNVEFVPRPDGSVGMSFDVTSRVNVEGSPSDPNMVRLVSNILRNPNQSTFTRSNALQWVRDTYRPGGEASPELVSAVAQLVRSDEHEGVRIRAVDALSSITVSSTSGAGARDALVEALRNDPNPAVRIRAIDALAAMASEGPMPLTAVDTLREKASQEDENPYVRVKAAEALGSLEL